MDIKEMRCLLAGIILAGYDKKYMTLNDASNQKELEGFVKTNQHMVNGAVGLADRIMLQAGFLDS